jgi:hypothetical protein
MSMAMVAVADDAMQQQHFIFLSSVFFVALSLPANFPTFGAKPSRSLKSNLIAPSRYFYVSHVGIRIQITRKEQFGALTKNGAPETPYEEASERCGSLAELYREVRRDGPRTTNSIIQYRNCSH